MTAGFSRYATSLSTVIAKGEAAHAASQPRQGNPYGPGNPDLRRAWFEGWDRRYLADLRAAYPQPKRRARKGARRP